jgi:intracellular sulfur oxidation DsrE/DsrF family protein
MPRLINAIACAALIGWGGALHAQPAGQAERIAYHFGDGVEQAWRALQYIRNHLEANPKAQIVVIAHAAGVDFLVKGAKSARGNEFLPLIEELDIQGVTFKVCEITLRERAMQRSQFVKEAAFVPSGVAELGRLQSREGYAYIRP